MAAKGSLKSGFQVVCLVGSVMVEGRWRWVGSWRTMVRLEENLGISSSLRLEERACAGFGDFFDWTVGIALFVYQ